MSSLHKALEHIREKANNDTELGSAFERLSKVFLENDATQTQQYSKVWHYSDWAKEHEGYSIKDIGIDLVAKLRDEDGYCAIQCKFYKSDHSISKSDLDSFISASSTSDFNRLMLIDTSTQPIGKNAQSVFDNLTQDYIRIQLSELEESRIDWSAYMLDGSVRLHSQKELRDHQVKALNAIRSGLEEDDRGKMIMACGTGKTFTSLRIAEDIAGVGKTVLYMVPSLALMSQTVREWKNDAKSDFTAFSACSDDKVGKKKVSNDQIVVNLNDLAFPATTDAKKLSEQIKNADKSKMTVVFSTYHSIDVISKSQHDHDLGDFDLIICDEAHRTTGATLVGDDESNFVKIHSNENVRGKKRLYMTATPRIYGETARRKEDEGEVNLASMDDETIFGKNLFHRGFGWAVENGLLTDYKVVVLMMDEQLVSDRVQRSFTDGAELDLDDATKMVGCYKALAKVGMKNDKEGIPTDTTPMKRALAFCQNIKTSQMFSSEFSNVVNEYISHEDVSEEHKTDLAVELFHVDGTFNAEQRNEKLGWLKDETEENICRVLTNARCLSEGVDVPALDAIMFLHPRKSQIDVVQSVGRVMRKAEGKKLGYVILPIAVAPGVSAEKALNDNDRYQVVWQILNALRAHDERFDSTINRIGLGEDVSDRIEIIDGTSPSELEATTSVVEDVRPKTKKNDNGDDVSDTNLGEDEDDEVVEKDETEQLSFTLTDLSQAIKAKIVEKCGTRDYWENWASDIAKIAQEHIAEITKIVINSGTTQRQSFVDFVNELRDDLNPDIMESDAIEMLAQHIITRPVFDSLFGNNNFTKFNGISNAMEKVLNQIQPESMSIENKSSTLQKFYKSVQRRADGIVTSNGRQTLILELYDKFFKFAFPELSKKLGIVYTPIPIVDFVINSVEEILQTEFGKSLGHQGVKILDPFAGTGTFISRLMQSGIISEQQLRSKYEHEIHANEIILLAYYISCVNIETVYSELTGETNYRSFNGMVLTDTFQLHEVEKDNIDKLMPENSRRRMGQKKSKINIIIGNPPYSVHARSNYPKLDHDFKRTIIDTSSAKQKSSLLDPFYKSIFWAASHIGKNGIVAFVINNSWIESSIADSYRKFLADNFSKIILVDLKGDVRKARFDRDNDVEGGNIFGNRSQNGIVIAIFVKKYDTSASVDVEYTSIGNNLNTEQKLFRLEQYDSLSKFSDAHQTTKITPNSYGDWLNPRLIVPKNILRLGDKSNPDNGIFLSYTSGIKTNRDEWAINFSEGTLHENMIKMIDTYYRVLQTPSTFEKSLSDDKNIKWDGTLETAFKRKKFSEFNKRQIRQTSLRPFVESNVYFSELYNNSIYLNNSFFPNGSVNNAIGIPGLGSRSSFSCLAVNKVPNYDFFDKSQFFPQFRYLPVGDPEVVDGVYTLNTNLEKKSNINPKALEKFRSEYNDVSLSEDELFYYTYALLNCSQYKVHFETLLGKEMPPVPFAINRDDLRAFCDLGKELLNVHINWKSSDEFSDGELFEKEFNFNETDDITKRVKLINSGSNCELRYGRTTLVSNIPSKILDTKYNGSSPLEWVLKRTQTRNYKKSRNTDDFLADLGAASGERNKFYVKHLKKIIMISINTVEIIQKLDTYKLNFTKT
jgi:predicted helicase